VLWEPEPVVFSCRGCDKSFGIFRFKHHCRCCGMIFCSDCTGFKATLPELELMDQVTPLSQPPGINDCTFFEERGLFRARRGQGLNEGACPQVWPSTLTLACLLVVLGFNEGGSHWRETAFIEGVITLDWRETAFIEGVITLDWRETAFIEGVITLGWRETAFIEGVITLGWRETAGALPSSHSAPFQYTRRVFRNTHQVNGRILAEEP
jgi:hypothetical protein